MRYYKKYIIFSVILMILYISCKETGIIPVKELEPAEKKWLAEHSEELYFAPDPMYAPFEFYDQNDKTTKGIANDYLNLIAKKLGIHFKILRASSFEQILELAKNKKVAIVNAATKTPERSEYLLFTEPIVEIKNIILTRKGDYSEISIDEILRKKIALVEGYAVTEYLVKKYPGLKYTLVPSDLSAILNVSYRMADAAVIDNATAIYFIEKEGISNLRISGDVGYPVRLAIGSRKDWPELNRILNKGLSALTQEEKRDIYHKWITVGDGGLTGNRIIRTAILTICILIGIAAVMSFLNRQLKKQIMIRTSDLNNALNDVSKSYEQNRLILKTAMDGFILIDLKGNIKEVNDAFCSMCGYTEDELFKINVSEFETPGIREALADNIERLFTLGQDRFETILLHKNGKSIDVEVSAQYKQDFEGSFVMFVRDITERKLAEEKIKNLLAEKELLLREVNHRIKNNMNTIKGLLTLQLSSETDSSIAESLRQAESRVQSMIILYDSLSGTMNVRELPVKGYLQTLTNEIVGSFPNSESISVNTDIDDFPVNIQILAPVGLIINELITNSMKYAFQDRETGEITINASFKNNHAVVVVRDNGTGIPDSVSFENSAGFGMQLVLMLTEQIGGSIRIERGAGTSIVLEFDV